MPSFFGEGFFVGVVTQEVQHLYTDVFFGSYDQLIPGSEAWFRKVFPVLAEKAGIDRVREHLTQEDRESDLRGLVEEWVGAQAFFFLTEFGAGKRLPVQPSYLAEIVTQTNEPEVYAFNLRDYGNQKKSYVDFDGVHPFVRKGLSRIYGGLAMMAENEGMIRVSPSEFYTNFGSHYDVVEFYRIREVREDNSRLMEGRYMVLDRKLSKEERLFLVNGMQDDRGTVPAFDGTNDLPYSIENLVLNPRMVSYTRGSDPVLDFMVSMSAEFNHRFGEPLVHSMDFHMYETIASRVADKASALVDLLLEGSEQQVIDLLRTMMFDSQREWAVYNNLDPDLHVQRILDGEIEIGFEMATTGDPLLNTWFDTIVAERYCEMHAKYYHGNCPDCVHARKN